MAEYIDTTPEEPNTRSSSGGSWSDYHGSDDGDKELAEALGSSEYLQGPAAPIHGLTCGGTIGGIEKESTWVSSAHTILIHHPACELHCIAGHPERPARVRVIMNLLRKRFPGMPEKLAPEATVEQIQRVHPQSHVDQILSFCAEAEAPLCSTRSGKEHDSLTVVRIDMDTAVMSRSREAILRAAGASCLAVDEVMSGRAVNAFCCVRPPGHHAEPNKSMGFCFFNNVSVGALHAQEVHGVEKVAVIDFDVHHGNGTQEFFQENPSMFYGSTHQGPYFYPGTGMDFEKGVSGNVVNVFLRSGEGSEGFRQAYTDKILPALRDFAPGLIMISAGFDAHKDDPLAEIMVEEEDYYWVTQKLCEVAAEVCGARVVSILEGGYNLDAIALSSVRHVAALCEGASNAVQEAIVSLVTAEPEEEGAVAVEDDDGVAGGDIEGQGGAEPCVPSVSLIMAEAKEGIVVAEEDEEGVGERDVEGRGDAEPGVPTVAAFQDTTVTSVMVNVQDEGEGGYQHGTDNRITEATGGGVGHRVGSGDNNQFDGEVHREGEGDGGTAELLARLTLGGEDIAESSTGTGDAVESARSS